MSRFAAGQKVRVANAHPPGHLRAPRYLRDRSGVILRYYGDFPNPERRAYGMSGLPALALYQVCFSMDEIWQGDGSYAPADTVTADIYEHWLEAVD
jgi:nitrile hydratase